MTTATANKLIAMPGAIFRLNESWMGGADRMIEMVVPTFLIEHPKGLVLFDTGCNLKVAQDFVEYLGPLGKVMDIKYSRDLVVDEQLKQHGYQPSQVNHVVLSHGHFDHAGGLAMFPDAQCYAMKGELRYALWPEPGSLGFIFDDIAPARNFKWTEPDADLDLFGDGSVLMMKTPGHTPGECSLMVRLKNETILLTGDTLHIRAQLKTLSALPGDFDQQQAAQSVKKLAEIERSGQARLWINHAPEDWASYPHVIE